LISSIFVGNAKAPLEGYAKVVGWGLAPPFRPETDKNMHSFVLKIYLRILAAGFYNTLPWEKDSMRE
jgi:hypothetical protein